MIEWKVDISHISGGYIEQAKVEALRTIAELLVDLNDTLAEMKNETLREKMR